jgi:hypothetical protein
MEDHRFIPEFSPTRFSAVVATPLPTSTNVVPITQPTGGPVARRFRKGDAVAEIRERIMREFQMIEWALILNGRVVTTRQFGADDRSDYDHEIHGVTSDLAGSGWIEESSVA